MTSRTAATLLAGWMLSACGASQHGAPPPATPGEPRPEAPTAVSAPAEREPTTLVEAEAALERARAELESFAKDDSRSQQEPAPAAPAGAPAAGEGGAEESRDGRAGRERELSGAGPRAAAASQCQTACKAFSSLLRARDAICRLEQPRGERCERAETIARESEARIQACACLR